MNMTECLRCVEICNSNSLEYDKKLSCFRLERRPALIKDNRCNECNMCIDVCPTHNIDLGTMNDCSFCIVCKSRPNCILDTNRDSFLNFGKYIIQLLIFKVFS